MLSLQASLVNGWNDDPDVNAWKTFGASATFTPTRWRHHRHHVHRQGSAAGMRRDRHAAATCASWRTSCSR
jgi:hypothetical protein